MGRSMLFGKPSFYAADIKTGYDEQMLSAGVGFKLSLGQIQSQLDYGYSGFGVLGDIHYIGIKLGF